MQAIWLVVVFAGTLGSGQQSALNNYQRSKAMVLGHHSHAMTTSNEQLDIPVEECAACCNAILDCRSFNYNWKTLTCQMLPWTEHSPNTQLQRNVHHDLYQKKDYVRPCITGTGDHYRGTVSRTESGKTCQPWMEKFPHDHRYSPDARNGLEENYCRNPTNDPQGPWCYTTDQSVRHQFCGIKKCNEDVCLMCNGDDYRGYVDQTESGKECQRWDLQAPHKHPYWPEKYPHKNLDDNYCRNPDKDRHGPWCYTMDPSTQFDYCAVKPCTRDQEPSANTGAENVTFESCGKREERSALRSRIIGGLPGNSPWTVSLRNRNGEHFCGGSLVKENWIISTLQCFSSCAADLTGYEAWLGTLLKNPKKDDPEKQAIPISDIVCGPNNSHLVMLKLERPAVLNLRVAIICLPPDRYIVPDDAICEIAGWGQTKGTGHEHDLKVATFRVMENHDCNIAHKGKLRENEMCTKPMNVAVGACEGDSGGPLACLTHDCFVLQGVIIHGRGCGRTGQPAIFIRASLYVDWINKVIMMN